MMDTQKLVPLLGSLALLGFMLHQTLSLYQTGWSLFQNVNLIFHEAGHTLFLWAPRFTMMLMGSGFEVVLPILIALYFYYHQHNVVGAQFGLWWTGTALWSAGIYAGDALERQLPLIGGLDDTHHDWYYLLLETGWLYSAETIGSNIYFLGTICITLALSWLGYTLYTQFTLLSYDRT